MGKGLMNMRDSPLDLIVSQMGKLRLGEMRAVPKVAQRISGRCWCFKHLNKAGLAWLSG